MRRAAGPVAARASYFQEHQFRRSGGVRYSDNDILGWRLLGRLDVPLLSRALELIAARHEALRTSFRSVDRGVVQVVHPTPALAARFEDLAGTRGHRAQAITTMAHEDLETPFVLSAPPVARATLVRLGTRDHVLLLSVGHLIWDAWSARIFERELIAFYAGTNGTPPPVPRQFIDFAEWERRPGSQSAHSYWRQALAGSSPLVPFPFDRAQRLSSAVHWQPIPPLPRQVVERLQRVARAHDASLATALLAAFCAALLVYCEVDELTIGMLHANRHHGDLAALIGFCASGLLVCVSASDRDTYAQVLASTREHLAQAFAHWVPIEQQVEHLSPARSVEYTPVIHDVTFNFIPHELARFASAGDAIELDERRLHVKPLVVPRRGYSPDATWHNASMVVTTWTTGRGGMAGYVEHNGAIAAAHASAIGRLLQRSLLATADDPRLTLRELRKRWSSDARASATPAGGAQRCWSS
jgi:pipecolate-incorporating enzyme